MQSTALSSVNVRSSGQCRPPFSLLALSVGPVGSKDRVVSLDEKHTKKSEAPLPRVHSANCDVLLASLHGACCICSSKLPAPIAHVVSHPLQILSRSSSAARSIFSSCSSFTALSPILEAKQAIAVVCEVASLDAVLCNGIQDRSLDAFASRSSRPSWRRSL